MTLNEQEQVFWDTYERATSEKPDACRVEAGMAGTIEIADELLSLYLCGRKTAGSSLLNGYWKQATADSLHRFYGLGA